MTHVIQDLLRAFRIRNELGEIYTNLVIRKFALTLITIFIPIYLLNIGFGLFMVVLFILLMWLVKGISSSIAGFLDARIGPKHTILVSVPLLLGFLSLLLLLDPALTPLARGIEVPLLVLAAVIGGLDQALYWVSLNAEFVKNTDNIHSGKETGHFHAYPQIGVLAAPAIGGLILSWLGFDFLIGIVILLVVISVFPLFLTSDYRERFRLKPLFARTRRNELLLAGIFVQGMVMFAEAFAWPLYLFLRFGDLLSVGAAASFMALGVMVFTMAIGRLSDQISRRRLLTIGAIGLAVLWLASLAITTVLEAFLLSFLIGPFLVLIYIPLFAMYSDFARDDPVNRTVLREWLLVAGFLVASLLVITTGRMESAFVLAAVGSLVFFAFR